jgi:hypothetical protein
MRMEETHFDRAPKTRTQGALGAIGRKSRRYGFPLSEWPERGEDGGICEPLRLTVTRYLARSEGHGQTSVVQTERS